MNITLTQVEQATVDHALAAGFLVANGQRLAVLNTFRSRCRMTGAAVVFVLGGKLIFEDIDTQVVVSVAQALGHKPRVTRGRVEIRGAGDITQVAAEIVDKLRRPAACAAGELFNAGEPASFRRS